MLVAGHASSAASHVNNHSNPGAPEPRPIQVYATRAIPNGIVFMSHSSHTRSWPLSQEANKSSGVCSVCRATRQLHLKDGTVHKHGPRDRPCQGSHKPPLRAVSQNQPSAASNTASVNVSVGASSTADTVNVAVDSQSASSRPTWSPPGCAVIKHIPKSARPLCASHLASVLRAIVADSADYNNWLALFNWSASILQPPKRSGKRHNLSNTIKKRISDFTPTTVQSNLDEGTASLRAPSPDHLLAQAVTTKLEDGNLRAAIRLMCSDDTPAALSMENLKRLQEKHPQAQPIGGPSPDPAQFTPLSVEEAEVRRAILSFPAGSSGGPDGMRPQHLKDLLLCRESGAGLLTALTAFVNLTLAGQCPVDAAPIFFGGRLIALNKKSGGLRPIVVGFTLRRLVSKCANAYTAAQLASYFKPIQLGVGISGGCEAAVHSARRFLETLPADNVVVKLDFSNAFNSLHRSDMLQSVADRAPHLLSYCHSAYSNPSVLYYGQFVIMSQEGPQQGDPLGPLLFCNTIHPLIESLSSALRLGYMDDVTLGGSQEAVARDVQRIMNDGKDLGLNLNVSKCELIVNPGCRITDPVLSSFPQVSAADAELLGAPLFPGAALDSAWSKRCDELARAVNRLALIGAQDALILLRASFSAPRVQHLLRCSPSANNSLLQTFDNLLRSAVDRITNSALSDIQWLQASMPIKQGGLGVRRVTSLATPAFLASAAGSLSLQDQILEVCTCQTDSHFTSYLTQWSASFGPPPDPMPSKQSFWDQPGILEDRSTIQASLVDQSQMACYLASVAPHSGDWLLALPIANCGLRLEDEAVRVAVGMRLGLTLCVPHKCHCGSDVDAHGRHAMVCKKAPGRVARHQVLNDIILRAINAADVPAVKEPSGLNRQDGKRPDGLSLIPWQSGKPLLWDVTVASTLAGSYVDTAATGAGLVADQAADRKTAKYVLF